MHLAFVLKLERADFHNHDNSNKQEVKWTASLLLQVQRMLWFG